MIGPHEGRELELMLAGQKSLACFHNAVPENGIISEEIIPEHAFAPYVAKGKIKRFSEDMRSPKNGSLVRHVCFALDGEEWRAEFFLWYTRQIYSKTIKYDPGQEYIIGQLLGYSTDDVREFVRRLT